MELTLFEMIDYKSYLLKLLSSKSKKGRGMRTGMARAAQCPPSQISKVLNGNIHLTPEQTDAISQYLGHTREEARYFFLLVQLGRAGTPSLRRTIQEQIEESLKKYRTIRERLAIQTRLPEESQTKYYSNWGYAAIRALVSVPAFQSTEAISKRLGISLRKTSEMLDFLTTHGFVLESSGRYQVGPTHLHLDKDSLHITRLHSNWRMRAIQSLDRESFEEDLHYSLIFSVSKNDAQKIKDHLLKSIQEVFKIIQTSPEEEVQCFTLDLFSL